MTQVFTLQPGELTLSQLRRVSREHVKIQIEESAYARMAQSEKTVQKIIAENKTVYGVNTGFGELAKVSIETEELGRLQRHIVLSHATGVGEYLDDGIVRLVLLLKINALAQGYSGIRRDVLDALITLYNAEVYPCIPSKGSVGASGDLAPLAHLTMPILGVGKVRYQGEIKEAHDVMPDIDLSPIVLGPKEGLALLNGTQVSTALALVGLFAAEDCYAAAVVSGCLSVDAAKGSSTPFKPEIHKVRRQLGQIKAAEVYRNLIQESEIRDSHRDGEEDDKVQDPYCLRCQPQVMGACLDQMEYAASIFEREANAVTDNPLIFDGVDAVYSGGNFHAEPIALAADALALSISEIGAMSERRIAMLIDHKVSGLPPFLVKDAGVNSGFMIAHVTAAALASENKQMSHPASVDSLPTSANQEDHVSMATHGARRLKDMAENTSFIVAIELLAATQGVEFHAPLKTSPILQEAMAIVREKVDPYIEDHYFSPDIRFAQELVHKGRFVQFMPDQFLPSKIQAA